MDRTRTIRTAVSASAMLIVVAAHAAVARPAAAAAPGVVPRGVVAIVSTGGIPVNVRTGPSLAHPRVGTLRNGTRLSIACRVFGQLVTGHVRRSLVWNRLSSGRYVADSNVSWRPRRPTLRACPGRSPTSAGTSAAGRMAIVSTGGIPVNVRTGPSLAHPRVGTLRNGTRLSIACRVFGQLVRGHVRRSLVWNRLSSGRYVADSNVSWRPRRPTLRTCQTAPDAIPAEPSAFIARMAGPARQSMRQHRVPASVTIAQAILESGWGRSGLSAADHNYFGIKCFGTPGPIAIGCRSYGTHECERSSCFATRATFRVYRNYRDSVRDHGRFLVVNPRYRPAFAHTRNANRFATEIHRAGYATAPGYARAIISLMRRYDLYRYDRR